MRRNPSQPLARPLEWRRAPADVVAAWPADTPLCALVSAGECASGNRARGNSANQSRWSIFAPATPASPSEPRPCGSDLPPDAQARALPFLSGVIGFIPHESGYDYEPSVFPPSDSRALWTRADAALVHDNRHNQWWAVASNAEALEELQPLLRAIPASASEEPERRGAAPFRAGPLRSDTGEAEYTNHVAHLIERIRAGDVYQVNLAHHLLAEFEGCPRALFLALLRAASPPFGALIESWEGERRSAVLSISPELFLDTNLAPSGGADGSRRVVTRPIKGTRADSPTATRDLRDSAKDAAELAMIVDLMRNDLGRVCEYGSVVVEDARAIERHAGGSLLHTVATVAGRLRPDVALDDLLRAAFPPASVTGAPKIAAMKLIRQLERRPRGAYCGAIGFVSDHGPTSLSVAIRTATITGSAISPDRPCEIRGELDFPVGAGIVADSDPASEWAETLAKSSAFAAALQTNGMPPRPRIGFPARSGAAAR